MRNVTVRTSAFPRRDGDDARVAQTLKVFTLDGADVVNVFTGPGDRAQPLH